VRRSRAGAAVFALSLSSCATHRPPVSPVFPSLGATQEGVASWYGPGYDGKATSSGERFDQDGLTAAHYDWAFGTRVRVTLLSTGQSVVVKINDRFPRRDRLIDLSRGAARAIGLIGPGTGRVRLEVVQRAGEETRVPARPPSEIPSSPAPLPLPQTPAAGGDLLLPAQGSLRIVFPSLGEVECQALDGPWVTCRALDGTPLLTVRSGAQPRLASFNTPGFPVVVAIARGAGEAETALLGESQGGLKELGRFRTRADDALCVGDLGPGKPPGAALWTGEPDGGRGARRFEVTRYAWTGSELRPVETGRSLRRYDTWETASWELGFSCRDILRE
jgi:rare lipoprotein A